MDLAYKIPIHIKKKHNSTTKTARDRACKIILCNSIVESAITKTFIFLFVIKDLETIESVNQNLFFNRSKQTLVTFDDLDPSTC